MDRNAIIEWDMFLEEGILREKTFRRKVEEINWEEYSEKNVVIKGCSFAHIPTWAYMILASRLAPHARHILYGEPRRAISIYKK